MADLITNLNVKIQKYYAVDGIKYMCYYKHIKGATDKRLVPKYFS